MRYRSKKIEIFSRLTALILWITIISMELYTLDTGAESYSNHSVAVNHLSAAACRTNRADAIADILGNITDEVTPDISSGTINNIVTYKINPSDYLFLLTKNRCILFLALKILLVLLLNAYIYRMYLILFIHNSDGEKGTAGILI